MAPQLMINAVNEQIKKALDTFQNSLLTASDVLTLKGPSSRVCGRSALGRRGRKFQSLFVSLQSPLKNTRYTWVSNGTDRLSFSCLNSTNATSLLCLAPNADVIITIYAISCAEEASAKTINSDLPQNTALALILHCDSESFEIYGISLRCLFR